MFFTSNIFLEKLCVLWCLEGTTHRLGQGFQTCGPPDVIVRPASSSNVFKFKWKLQFHLTLRHILPYLRPAETFFLLMQPASCQNAAHVLIWVWDAGFRFMVGVNSSLMILFSKGTPSKLSGQTLISLMYRTMTLQFWKSIFPFNWNVLFKLSSWLNPISTP